jgi:hypothetical protein
MAAVQGGVVIQRPSDNAFLGGIGVSGLAAQEDRGRGPGPQGHRRNGAVDPPHSVREPFL